MSIGENIKNSIQVLYKTYENVNKLMANCKMIAGGSGYVKVSDKFLRWKSDDNSDGWLLNSFILLFQKDSDTECESGNNWRNGAVYAVEICLGMKSEVNLLPELLVSKFDYKNLDEWGKSVSPAEHWRFYQPIRQEYVTSFCCQTSIDNISIFTPRSEKVAKTYWGIEKVVSVSYPLMRVTSDNLKELVFGTFNKFSDIQ